MALHEDIAERLKRERSEKRVSQQDLAMRLGVAPNTVSRWETGTSRPRLEDLDRIAEALGIGVAALIPQYSSQPAPAARLLDILRDLSVDDVAEVERYAEFRRAQRRDT